MAEPIEPTDPDLASSQPRPLHRHPSLVVVVIVGGSLGTWVRAAIESALPAPPGSWPWATFLINLSGAFVLGALLELLARLGADTGWRRQIRLLGGTGFLGGYTTYSTFAVEVTQLSLDSPHLAGLAYALASLVLGPAGAALGYLTAKAGHARGTVGRGT